MSVECGGGHRSWASAHLPHGGDRFVYLKAGIVHVVDSEPNTSQSILKPPLHGREVCDTAFMGFAAGQTGL